ncbi:MAG: ubiquinol-cytochrome C chaperone family protein [Henriciella sp.]|uniref:ubiquinol-cytochrome C chaperone family protein n=1 Tax=Henriciella sp. TaxID=1968823 RepID=UPI003C723A06
MLSKLFFPERAGRHRTASALYHDLNSAARKPWLFIEGGIPDTIEGRFHAVALHAALLLPELERRKPEGPKHSEAVYIMIFDGFDAALREKGVGDASIARRIRKMGETFFGLGQSIQAALKEADAPKALRDVLRRNAICEPSAQPLVASYLQTAHEKLGNLADDELLNGRSGLASVDKSSVG